MSALIQPLIQMDAVARAVDRNGSIMALRNATFKIAAGEFVAIVGPSGSGKTTLLSILGLLDRPTSGTYLLNGFDVSAFNERTRNSVRGKTLGFVFQNSYLLPSESVADNVALGLRVRGIPRRERAHLVASALAKVGLSDALRKRASNLSGGEKQRVALARALVASPALILADEPTGAVDTDSTLQLIKLLGEINSSGTTVIVVTHDPLVAKAASRKIMIVDGILHEKSLLGGAL